MPVCSEFEGPEGGVGRGAGGVVLRSAALPQPAAPLVVAAAAAAAAAVAAVLAAGRPGAGRGGRGSWTCAGAAAQSGRRARWEGARPGVEAGVGGGGRWRAEPQRGSRLPRSVPSEAALPGGRARTGSPGAPERCVLNRRPEGTHPETRPRGNFGGSHLCCRVRCFPSLLLSLTCSLSLSRHLLF